MDKDSFILSIKTTNLLKDLKYFKDDFDFSELDKSHDLYDTIKKKVIGKTKIETSLIIELDSFVASRSKSDSFSYKESKNQTKRNTTYTNPQTIYKFFLNSQKTTATNYSIRSNAHILTVQKQDKLALNPFDDQRVYLNPIQSLSWSEHTQKGDCSCIYCLKLVGLYYKELIYYKVKIVKQMKNYI